MRKKSAKKQLSKEDFGVHIVNFFLILFFGSLMIGIWPKPILLIGLIIVDVTYLLCILIFSKTNFSLHFRPSVEWLIVLFLVTFAIGFITYLMITEGHSLGTFLARYSRPGYGIKYGGSYPLLVIPIWALAFSMCFKLKQINKDK